MKVKVIKMQEYIQNMQKKIQDQADKVAAQQEELKKQSESKIIIPGNDNNLVIASDRFKKN